MSKSKRSTSDPIQLACRRCTYTTDTLRTSCPHCGGDMIAES